MPSTGARDISCTYLIASHTQPQGVSRLARIVVSESPTSSVFVHHDAGAGQLPLSLFEGLKNVSIAPDPIAAQWGTFSLVDLVVRSLRQIRNSGSGCDWVVLLSGQHYPARSLRDFEHMLANCGADAIMSFERVMPSDRHLNDRYGFHYRRFLNGPLPRVLRAKRLYDTVFNRAQPFFRVQTDDRGSFLGWRPRNSVIDLDLPVYIGSQWWALSRAAVDAVLDAVDNSDFVERYAGTLIPDESFFQTVIVNSRHLKSVKGTLHYETFPANRASPRFLTLSDLPAIRASAQWFARKIDAANDDGLSDALDVLRTEPLSEHVRS
jgi:hypothetical protein